MSGVGIGVIGCGGMGLYIVRLVLAQDARLRVAGLYDPDPRSIVSALNEWPEDTPVMNHYTDVLADPSVDWVMIASWNCFHCEQIVAAFEAGKNVFCQKPLAANLEECLRIKQAWAQSGRQFHIGFTLRFSPHYRKIRSLLADGAIGDIVSMEFNEVLDFNHGGYIMGDWRRKRAYAGTHLLEKCCHDIDLANWMTNSRVSRAASFGGINFFIPENARHIERIGADPDGKKAYGTWDGLIGENPFTSDKDIVDNQVVILEYENSVRATFHTNCNAAIPERRMLILGTEGTMRADVIAGTIECRRIGFDTPVEDFSTEASGGHGGGDDVLAAELADSMLNGAPPSAGLEEGLASAVTCFAVDEALDTGRVVDLAPYWQAVI